MRDSSPPNPLDALLADHADAPELAFTPVPVRVRCDGWTAARQAGFIQRLALCGSVSAAAGGVGMSKRSAYRLREHPRAGEFSAAWDRAIGWGESTIVDHAILRALEGEVRPVFYRGRKVGENRRYDTSLLIAVLNSREVRAVNPLENSPVAAVERPSLKTKDFHSRP